MIIAINGKKQSGKDMVGKIIQLFFEDIVSESGYDEELITTLYTSGYLLSLENKWEIKKFADPLKKIISILTGCNMAKFESEEFKTTPLGEDWVVWKLINNDPYDTSEYQSTFSSYEEMESYIEENDTWGWEWERIELTPRMLLTGIGNDLFRDKLHPKVWVNALMNQYSSHRKWIITDLRYLNCLEEIRKHKNVTIKVIRPGYSDIKSSDHPSETGLDGVDLDYVIFNDSDIKKVVSDVKKILIKEKLICGFE